MLPYQPIYLLTYLLYLSFYLPSLARTARSVRPRCSPQKRRGCLGTRARLGDIYTIYYSDRQEGVVWSQGLG